MKFIRFIGSGLLLVIAIVAILAAAAFVPAVQTWAAQMALAKLSGIEGSLGSLSAGLGKIEVADLHLKTASADLTLPSIQIQLPLAALVWNRKVVIRSLVAKGWTLDLSRAPHPEAARAPADLTSENGGTTGPPIGAETAPEQMAGRILRGFSNPWHPPCDVSLDGVELEGDVLVPAVFGKTPDRVHLVFKGGGVAAGREGIFAIDAAGVAVDPSFQMYSGAAHGRLAVAMDSSRTLQRAEVRTDLSVKGGTLPKDLALSVDLAAARGSGGEICTLDISRGRRDLATVSARFADASRRMAGTWKIDCRNSDLAPFVPDSPLPSFSAAGEGTFDSDPDFIRVHATGRLKAAASRLGVLAKPLERIGLLTLDTRFDLAHKGNSIRFELLSLSLAGARPAADFRSLQAFELDLKTGVVAVADPRRDWMEGSIRAFPLAWVSGLTGDFTFAGDDATGEFVVRAAHDGFALRPRTPLTVAGVSLNHRGWVIGRGLDLSLSLLADYSSHGWQVRWAPFTIAGAGRRLAACEGNISRPAGTEKVIAITGTWTADLDALAARPAIPGPRWIAGRSASGDFSAKVGTATEAEAKLALVGHDPGHAIAVSVQADVDADGAVAFLAPIKLGLGSSASEVSAEGTWSRDEGDSRVDAKLTGGNVDLEHLRWLVAPLAAAGGAPLPAGPAASIASTPRPAEARDLVPFWGAWVGRLTIAFDQLRAGIHDLKSVAATLDLDHGSVQLTGGRAELSKRRLATMEGAVTFDAVAKFPYSLKASAAIDVVDASQLFAQQKSAQNPVIEGRFSVTGTLTGKGVNLDDLAGRTQEEFRMTSTTGIVRLFETNVGESIPTPEGSGVSDALGTVGSAMGSLFGINRKSKDSDAIHLSKNTEAVIDFSYRVAEIGCDEISVTAVRGSDRTIRLVGITMTAPNLRLTGSGQITYVEGRPLSAEPLELEFQFGARGRIAQLLSTAGLLSSRKDESGYALLNQPIRFAGTLEQVDKRQWNDLLVKAATRKPAGGKKGGSGDGR